MTNEHFSLVAKTREIPSHDLAASRAAGQVPAELYGHNIPNTHLWLEVGALEKVWRQAGESSIIDLAINEQITPVLIYDYQKDPVSGDFLHVDFYQVKMDEEIETSIPLNFIGESSAVEAEGGILVKALSELEIACLPGDLVHEITVDISVLADFESVIKVKDLILPKGLMAKVDGEVVVAMVDRPRSAEELAALAGEVKTELPEGAAEEKPVAADKKEEKE